MINHPGENCDNATIYIAQIKKAEKRNLLKNKVSFRLKKNKNFVGTNGDFQLKKITVVIK